MLFRPLRKTNFHSPLPKQHHVGFIIYYLVRVGMGQLQLLPLGFLCNYISYLIGQRFDTGVVAVAKYMSILVLYLGTVETTTAWVCGPSGSSMN